MATSSHSGALHACFTPEQTYDYTGQAERSNRSGQPLKTTAPVSQIISGDGCNLVGIGKGNIISTTGPASSQVAGATRIAAAPLGYCHIMLSERSKAHKHATNVVETIAHVGQSMTAIALAETDLGRIDRACESIIQTLQSATDDAEISGLYPDYESNYTAYVHAAQHALTAFQAPGDTTERLVTLREQLAAARTQFHSGG